MNNKTVKEILAMKKIVVKNPNPKRNDKPHPGKNPDGSPRLQGGFPIRCYSDLVNAIYDEKQDEQCFMIGRNLAYKTKEQEQYILYETMLVFVDKVNKKVFLNNYNDEEDKDYTTYSTERAISFYYKELKAKYNDFEFVDNRKGYAIIDGKLVNVRKLEEKAEQLAKEKAIKDEEKAKIKEAKEKAKLEKEALIKAQKEEKAILKAQLKAQKEMEKLQVKGE